MCWQAQGPFFHLQGQHQQQCRSLNPSNSDRPPEIIYPTLDNPKIVSHAAEQFWVPLPYCSLPGCPFPIKSLGLPAHVSPQTIHFRVLDKSPVLGPRKGPPSYNTYTTQLGPRVQISQGCSQGVDHNNPQLGKKLLPGSHSCWQNSIPCELLD